MKQIISQIQVVRDMAREFDERSFSFKEEKCSRCNGTGKIDTHDTLGNWASYECHNCHGSKKEIRSLALETYQTDLSTAYTRLSEWMYEYTMKGISDRILRLKYLKGRKS